MTTADNSRPYEYCPVPINASTWPIVLEMVVDGEAPIEWADYVEDYLRREWIEDKP